MLLSDIFRFGEVTCAIIRKLSLFGKKYTCVIIGNYFSYFRTMLKLLKHTRDILLLQFIVMITRKKIWFYLFQSVYKIKFGSE